MKEVEVKVRIKDVAETIKLFESQGHVFTGKISQRDAIYIPLSEPTVPVALGANVLRVRREDSRTLFTLKQGQELAKLEKELEISDPETLEEIFELLGYKKIAQVNKLRRKAKAGDLEICVDEVEGLGCFVEVEKITAEDPAKIQAGLLEFLLQSGVDITQRERVGYDILYVQKYGKA